LYQQRGFNRTHLHTYATAVLLVHALVKLIVALVEVVGILILRRESAVEYQLRVFENRDELHLQ
jgi:hypothetical protein